MVSFSLQERRWEEITRTMEGREGTTCFRVAKVTTPTIYGRAFVINNNSVVGFCPLPVCCLSFIPRPTNIIHVGMKLADKTKPCQWREKECWSRNANIVVSCWVHVFLKQLYCSILVHYIGLLSQLNGDGSGPVSTAVSGQKPTWTKPHRGRSKAHILCMNALIRHANGLRLFSILTVFNFRHCHFSLHVGPNRPIHNRFAVAAHANRTKPL